MFIIVGSKLFAWATLHSTSENGAVSGTVRTALSRGTADPTIRSRCPPVPVISRRLTAETAVTVAGSSCSAARIACSSSPAWMKPRSTKVALSKVTVRVGPAAPILIVS